MQILTRSNSTAQYFLYYPIGTVDFLDDAAKILLWNFIPALVGNATKFLVIQSYGFRNSQDKNDLRAIVASSLIRLLVLFQSKNTQWVVHYCYSCVWVIHE